MQEYIKELQDKVGLTEEQATQAVMVLFEKIKSKIPEPLQAMAANMFAGDQEEGSLLDKLKQFQKNAGGEG